MRLRVVACREELCYAIGDRFYSILAPEGRLLTSFKNERHQVTGEDQPIKHECCITFHEELNIYSDRFG